MRPLSGLVRQCAAAVALVSAGIMVGDYVPGSRGGPRTQSAAVARSGSSANANAAAAARRVPVSAPDSISIPPAATQPAAPRDPSIPPAPGFDSFLANAPRPEFAGGYAVLRGASTAGPAGLASAEPAPHPFRAPATSRGADGPVAAAPAVRVASAGADGGTSAEADAGGGAAPAPHRGFLGAPGQAIPRGIAAGYPLLAIGRSGGRVAFYDLGVRGGPTPAGIEGEWAVVGRCGTIARVEFALPAARAGELRGIGSGLAGAGHDVVVARQGCAGATPRLGLARAPTAGELAQFGGAAGALGFGAEDLRHVASHGPVVALLFRKGDEAALVVAPRSGAEAGWQRKITSAGAAGLVGVYRSGGGFEVWAVHGGQGGPVSLLRATSPDSRSWSTDGSIPLSER